MHLKEMGSFLHYQASQLIKKIISKKSFLQIMKPFNKGSLKTKTYKMKQGLRALIQVCAVHVYSILYTAVHVNCAFVQ